MRWMNWLDGELSLNSSNKKRKKRKIYSLVRISCRLVEEKRHKKYPSPLLFANSMFVFSWEKRSQCVTCMFKWINKCPSGTVQSLNESALWLKRARGRRRSKEKRTQESEWVRSCSLLFSSLLFSSCLFACSFFYLREENPRESSKHASPGKKFWLYEMWPKKVSPSMVRSSFRGCSKSRASLDGQKKRARGEEKKRNNTAHRRRGRRAAAQAQAAKKTSTQFDLWHTAKTQCNPETLRAGKKEKRKDANLHFVRARERQRQRDRERAIQACTWV